MSFEIDSTTYPKAKTYPQRHGYQLRGTAPSSGVIHSTNNRNKNTLFAAEADYLYRSPDVSAHFLVGKDGRIVQFLDPRAYQAWHAGEALQPWTNPRSIGIELHHSVGDPPYPAAQEDALTWLVRRLMEQFHIPPSLIETHRKIAIPGPDIRKHDPNDWSDADFYAWRAGLVAAPYRVLQSMWVSETTTARGPIAANGQAVVERGDTVIISEVRPDGWCHLQNGLGFVPIGGLEKL